MTERKMPDSPWIVTLKRNVEAQMSFWCFPYAGATAHVYRSWADGLPNNMEVHAIQLPGRGSRLAEPAFLRIPPLIELLASETASLLDRPFAFFGHSLGAMIGFELASHLARFHGLMCSRLFVSGCRAPQYFHNGRDIHKLSQDAFVHELRRFGGTPDELLRDEELMRISLPALRSDFELFETHRHARGEPLGCGITAFGGLDDDEVPQAQLEAWSLHTKAQFACHMRPGGHFFLHERQQEMLALIRQDIYALQANGSMSKGESPALVQKGVGV
jgi:medium-chain acyl-[acyl-carrier-protein] hydrolase